VELAQELLVSLDQKSLAQLIGTGIASLKSYRLKLRSFEEAERTRFVQKMAFIVLIGFL